MPDLTFTLDADRPAVLVGWPEYEVLVAELAGHISALGQDVALVGFLHGGLMVAQSLADRLGCPIVVAMAAEPSGDPRLIYAVDGVIADPFWTRRTVVIDEVVDSGRTMEYALSALSTAGYHKPIGATLFAGRTTIAGLLTARRMDPLPNIVLPWRVLRDFPATAGCLLADGPKTSEEIADALEERGFFGLYPERLETSLALARAAGVVNRSGNRWEWRR